MASSFVSSPSSKTLEVTLPNQQFDDYLRKLSLQRSNTHPANMARDSGSYCSSQHRRSSYSSSYSTSSRSRAPDYNCAVQLPAARGRPDRRDDDDTCSNVTGYRRCLDVPGSPPNDYFTSGASKRDRRPEFAGHSYSGSSAATNGYPIRNEIVRYKDNFRNGSPEESDEDDNATVTPEDSISQISSNRSTSYAHARPAVHSRWSSYSQHPVRPPPITNHRSNSYSCGVSAYDGEQVYPNERGFVVVVRRPPRAR